MHLGRGLEEEFSNRLPAYESTIGVRAPIIWRIHQVETVIGAGAMGPKVLYRWQRPLVLTHMQVMARSGVSSDLAALELSWEDGRGNQVPTSGRLPIPAACFALFGGGKWFDIEVPVLHNEVHTFQFSNFDGQRAIIPLLFFLCVERDAP